MFTIARGSHRFLFAIAFTLIASYGCSKHSTIDPWEAVKLAHEAKNRADLITSLQQLPAEIYALKLITGCQSDATKCVEALQVLEFAYSVTEGADSTNAQIACQFKNTFALMYLADIYTDLEMKLVGGTLPDSDAATIRARLVDIQKIKDRFINQCDRHK